MLPTSLQCTECDEKIAFPIKDRAYYIGTEEKPKAVLEEEYLGMNLDPAWCSSCEKPSWVEAIPTMSQLEQSFALVKSGHKIEFPIYSEFLSKDEALFSLKKYLEWIKERKSGSKCVVCGEKNFVVLGGNAVKLRHEHCDYGVFKPVYFISSHNGPMQTLIHNSEGLLMGKLSYWDDELNGWLFVKNE